MVEGTRKINGMHNFDELMSKLVRVPKSELEAEIRKEQRQKAKAKKDPRPKK